MTEYLPVFLFMVCVVIVTYVLLAGLGILACDIFDMIREQGQKIKKETEND